MSRLLARDVKGSVIAHALSALLLCAGAYSQPAEQLTPYGLPIRQIEITGLKYTKEFVVRRELVSREGEICTKENLAEDLKRLDQLGVFSAVEIIPVPVEQEAIIIIDVYETFPYLPMVSTEITDENGISVGGGLKSLNLFGRAIHFSVSALFGGARSVEIAFRNPRLSGNRLVQRFDYSNVKRRNELFEFDETAHEMSLTLTSHVRSRGRVGAHFSYQAVESDTNQLTLSADNRDNVLSAGCSVGFDSRDLPSNPTRGWWNDARITRSGLLGSDSGFWRADLDIRRYFSVMPRNTVALYSLTTLTSGTIGEQIAVWQVFGLGGTNSIRGWKLGSRRGKNQFINTMEYRYTLMNPHLFRYFGVTTYLGLQLAVFGDVGTAWSHRDEFSDSFIGGVGLGIRLILPSVGLARIDFGIGQRDAGVQVHLGAYEKPVLQRKRVR